MDENSESAAGQTVQTGALGASQSTGEAGTAGVQRAASPKAPSPPAAADDTDPAERELSFAMSGHRPSEQQQLEVAAEAAAQQAAGGGAAEAPQPQGATAEANVPSQGGDAAPGGQGSPSIAALKAPSAPPKVASASPFADAAFTVAQASTSDVSGSLARSSIPAESQASPFAAEAVNVAPLTSRPPP